VGGLTAFQDLTAAATLFKSWLYFCIFVIGSFELCNWPVLIQVCTYFGKMSCSAGSRKSALPETLMSDAGTKMNYEDTK
jgi:hypothetical protein